MTGIRNRGVTAVVGLTLLIGIVAVGSVTVLVIGDNIQQSSQERIDDTRIETSFIQLDERIASVSKGKSTRATVDFDLANSATGDTAIRKEATGKIVIKRTNLSASKEVARKDIGSIVYTRDGEQYTYQAGAVWRNTGNATELVSAPQVSYEFSAQDGRPRPTLNLAIPELEGNDRIGSGEVAVAHNETIAPFNNVSTVDNELITMSVTSEFYVGWGDYFEDRYPDVSTVSYDHPNDTVTVSFGKRDIDGEFDSAIEAGGDISTDNGNPSTEGPIKAGGTVSGTTSCSDTNVTCGVTNTRTPLDPVIDSRISKAKSDYPDKSFATENGGMLTAGSYYTDEFNVDGETLTLDLSSGNISLYVDGPIGVDNGKIDVINADQNATCCVARLYVGDSTSNGRGDIAIAKGGATIDATDDNAGRVQVYGTSEMHFAMGQATPAGDGVDAVIYAPHDGDSAMGSNTAVSVYSLNSANNCGMGMSGTNADVCVGQGNGNFNGAVIGFHDVEIEQSTRVEFDNRVQNFEPTLGYAGVLPPPITYLQVSVHEICVGDDRPTC